MKVLLIDSHNLFHRARWSFNTGQHTTSFNFFRMLRAEIEKHEAELVYIVDEGKPVLSLELDENYKGTRKRIDDDNFSKEMSDSFSAIINYSGMTYIKHPQRECDDVIAYLARKKHFSDDVVVVSTDTDFIQLIDERVAIWNPQLKKFFERPDYDYVLWKALKGDLSDNVRGVPGVGEKTATKLVMSPAALEDFFEKKPQCLASFELAKQLIAFKDLEESDCIIARSNLDEDLMREWFSNRNFKSIIGNAWPKWTKMLRRISNHE